MTNPDPILHNAAAGAYLRPQVGRPLPTVANGTSHHRCPRCDGRLIRAWRRPVDRFMCNFVPLHRYRCGDFSCQWEGNLRTARGKESQNDNERPLMMIFGIIVAAVVMSLAAIAWFSSHDLDVTRLGDQPLSGPQALEVALRPAQIPTGSAGSHTG